MIVRFNHYTIPHDWLTAEYCYQVCEHFYSFQRLASTNRLEGNPMGEPIGESDGWPISAWFPTNNLFDTVVCDPVTLPHFVFAMRFRQPFARESDRATKQWLI